MPVVRVAQSPCLSSVLSQSTLPRTCRRLRAPEKPHGTGFLMSSQHNRALRKLTSRDQLIPATTTTPPTHTQKDGNLSSAQNKQTWVVAQGTQVKKAVLCCEPGRQGGGRPLPIDSKLPTLA